MNFITLHNLDRNVDEQVNADHITRIRNVQSQVRDQKKCTITFNSNDSMTALGSADDVLAKIQGRPAKVNVNVD